MHHRACEGLCGLAYMQSLIWMTEGLNNSSEFTLEFTPSLPEPVYTLWLQMPSSGLVSDSPKRKVSNGVVGALNLFDDLGLFGFAAKGCDTVTSCIQHAPTLLLDN
jgi:hypothetical protein